MTRYVIIGAGAVGVTLGAELLRSGREAVLVGRGRQLELLRAGQLRYLRPHGGWTVEVPAVGSADEISLNSKDVLVLATKTQDADEVLAAWARQPVDGGRWRAGEVLPVFTLQNGLDVERSALRRFATVVGSVLWVPSTYVTDGEILSPGAPAVGVFWVGNHPDAIPSASAQTIAGDLRHAGFEVQVVEDLSRWKAAKLLAGVTFALDALYAPGPERDRAARLVQDEAREILTAAGVDVADFRTESTVHLDRFESVVIDGRVRPGSSTWQSLARGRSVETDFLNGEITLLARQLGRRAPVNAAVLARVQRAVHERTGARLAPGRRSRGWCSPSATVLVDAATLRAELAGSTAPACSTCAGRSATRTARSTTSTGTCPARCTSTSIPSWRRRRRSRVGGTRCPARRISSRPPAAGVCAHGRAVVVYDDNGGQSAARAWWLLRWAGVSDVRILDGGLGAWAAAGGQLVDRRGSPRARRRRAESRAPAHPRRRRPRPHFRPGACSSTRGPRERYRGEVEPVDSRAGHIPGAISLPTAANLGPDGRFLPVAELRRGSPVAADATEVGVYCGSGVTAAHEIAALQAAGIDAALYPGSWSAWSGDPARPVATGAQPSQPACPSPDPVPPARHHPEQNKNGKPAMAVEFISAVNVNPSNELNRLGRAEIDLPVLHAVRERARGRRIRLHAVRLRLGRSRTSSRSPTRSWPAASGWLRSSRCDRTPSIPRSRPRRWPRSTSSAEDGRSCTSSPAAATPNRPARATT